MSDMIPNRREASRSRSCGSNRRRLRDGRSSTGVLVGGGPIRRGVAISKARLSHECDDVSAAAEATRPPAIHIGVILAGGILLGAATGLVVPRMLQTRSNAIRAEVR